MKFRIYLYILAVTISFAASAQDVMTKAKDGTDVVNTTTLCADKGFKDTTPVLVYIKKGKVVKVEPLKNQESPGVFSKVVDGLLPLYKNLKINKAKELARSGMVDACTGATYSTKAVQKNIKAALEYYEKHK